MDVEDKNTVVFQSTPSSRRATMFTFLSIPSCQHFNPRPPHGGRQENIVCITDALYISIHALLTEGDKFALVQIFTKSYFNPRPPHGGRRVCLVNALRLGNFNPRPPHGGRPQTSPFPANRLYFNPRPPHGGRQGFVFLHVVGQKFQSTPSSRRATFSLGTPPSV